MIGVILAGGRSSRMGIDKAGHEVAGKAIAQWVAGALGTVCDRVVIAGRTEGFGGIEPIPDTGGPYRGPLAGIASCAHLGRIAVVAVDQPWVRPETMRALDGLDGDLPVVPIDNGNRQATCAIYPSGLGEIAREELEAGGSVQTLLDRVAFRAVTEGEWRTWGEDGRSWFSVDTPRDAEEGLRRFGPPQPPM